MCTPKLGMHRNGMTKPPPCELPPMRRFEEGCIRKSRKHLLAAAVEAMTGPDLPPIAGAILAVCPGRRRSAEATEKT